VIPSAPGGTPSTTSVGKLSAQELSDGLWILVAPFREGIYLPWAEMSLISQILRFLPVVMGEELAPSSHEYRLSPSGLALPPLTISMS
jgi:hypothetical protein